MVLEGAVRTLTRLAGQVPPDRLPEISSRLQQLQEHLHAGCVETNKPEPTA
jgi:hypothetical protein